MSKSALGIDPAEYGVTDPMHAWRIRKARREVERRELLFIRNNPDRRFFVRKSLPYEQDGWSATDHERCPLILVRYMPDTDQMHRMQLKCDPSTILNTEEFCRALYFRVCPTNDDGTGETSLSAEGHALLLEAAGVEVKRSEQERAHD